MWPRVGVALLSLLVGCVSVELPLEDGRVLKVTTPGAVCATYDGSGAFLLSVDPRSDFGTTRAFSWLALLAAAANPFSPGPITQEMDAKSPAHDSCDFLFDGLDGGTVDIDLGTLTDPAGAQRMFHGELH